MCLYGVDVLLGEIKICEKAIIVLYYECLYVVFSVENFIEGVVNLFRGGVGIRKVFLEEIFIK